MAEYRAIPTGLWIEDEWFSTQTVDGRLLWIWMGTNSEASSSWQPMDIDRITREVRISADVCAELFLKFEKDGRIETALHDEKPVFRIFVSDKRCANCGAGCDITTDHVTPRSWGGSNNKQNLQLLCRSCNSRKGNRHDTRY